MNTKNNKPTSERTDNSRNAVIDANVISANRALLQKMKKELELSVNECMYLRKLADLKACYRYEKELERINQQLTILKLSLLLIDCNLRMDLGLL
ncbi:MAG: hypothetical protein JEZ09_14450 [Salinivirgaceae bacterium]|nr:hypothetical protein [Salinivirgaceae bacterium]